MPRNIYVCFTCLRDSALLPLHYTALKRALPGVRVYYVFEPEEGRQADVPEGAFRVLAPFPHNRNLLGLRCHLGMLQTMKHLSEQNGMANAIKIDADVILRSDYFLSTLGTEHDMVGVAPAQVYYCKGTCYGMTHSLICKTIQYLSHGYMDLSDRLEDSTISMAAAIVSDANRIRIHNARSADGSEFLYSIFTRRLQQEPRFISSIRGFIDCGDPIYTRDFPDAIEAKAAAMRFILQQNL